MQHRDFIYKYWNNETLTEAESRYVAKFLKSSNGFFRHPQTLNEMRQNAAMVCDEDVMEYGIRIRPSRRPENLPDEWDDIPTGTKIEHRKPWRSRRQRALIARAKSGQYVFEPKEV